MPWQRLGHHGFRHILHCFREIEHWVAAKISRWQHNVLDLHAVHANEPMSKIIEAHAELCPAISGFEVPGVRTKTDVGLCCHRSNIGCIRLVNFAARETAGDVDPIIRPKGWMAYTQLRCVAIVEASQDDAANISPAIAVSIFEKNNIGRACYDEAPAPGHDAVREGQAVRENGSLVVSTIAVAVFE